MDEAKISILYAEDDEFGAKLTKTILEKENFEVEIVSDGSEAWKAYKERKPDILLLDLDMPGKDGLEITGWSGNTISKHPSSYTPLTENLQKK